MKHTKRALLLSALAIVMSVAMLIGSTFAWFADSASTAVNTIQSGTLKIDIASDKDGNDSLKDRLINFVAKDGTTAVLWEPNCTFDTQEFYIVNEGNLNLKFKFDITGAAGDLELFDVIELKAKATFGTTEIENALGQEYVLAPGAYFGPVVITGHMDKDAGNDYQDKEITGLAINLIATQANVESDSNGTDYDKDAEYDSNAGTGTTPPVVNASTAAELQAALSPTVSNDTAIVNINSDIILAAGETWTPLDLEPYSTTVKNIVIEGNGHTISGLNAPLIGDAHFGNTSIKINNLTLTNVNISEQIYNSGCGAFIAYANHCEKVEMSNCHLADSSIATSLDMSGVGGLIGYCDSPLTMTNCSVVRTTINGSLASAGAAVGAIGYTDVTMTGIKVADCVVKGEKIEKTGYVIGSNLYCTSAVITTVDCANNTVLDVANSNVVYGRYLGTGVFKLNGTAQ